MTTDTLDTVAGRIHLLLRRELGQGIEVQRMLAEPLYARDVLLVCDALPGGELAALAQQFRQAGAADSGRPDARPSTWPRDSSGFGASLPPATDADAPVPAAAARPAPRRWLSPMRWLSRP